MTQTAQQYTEFRLAVTAGLVRDIAIMRGATGHKRRPLTSAEYASLRFKRQRAKDARRINRR